jgi:hypothetical protein
MSDTSGPMSYAPFARWDRDSQSWRTSEATSLWDLELSSLTLPAWGGLHDGELCEHPTPERLTNGLDYSSLPTPRTSDTNGSGKYGDGGLDLRTAVTMLPTPRATDGPKGGPGQVNGRGVPDSLPAISALLPTPAVNDMGRGKTPEDWDAWTAKMQAAHGNGNGHGKSLEIEAQRLLPTPTQQHSSGGYNPEWGHGMTLLDAAKEIHLLGTPTATMRHGSDKGISKNPNPAEVAAQAAQTGVITQRPSLVGSASSEDQPQHQLSLDGLAHPA